MNGSLLFPSPAIYFHNLISTSKVICSDRMWKGIESERDEIWGSSSLSLQLGEGMEREGEKMNEDKRYQK